LKKKTRGIPSRWAKKKSREARLNYHEKKEKTPKKKKKFRDNESPQ